MHNVRHFQEMTRLQSRGVGRDTNEVGSGSKGS